MQVLYGEGLASHTGPESCVAVREDRCEALTGECVGQPLSGENQLRGADVLRPSEGDLEPGMRRILLFGNREISRLSVGSLHGLRREGRRP